MTFVELLFSSGIVIVDVSEAYFWERIDTSKPRLYSVSDIAIIIVAEWAEKVMKLRTKRIWWRSPIIIVSRSITVL